MKSSLLKFAVSSLLLVFVAVAADAQPRSFGIRAGNGLEMSYQHDLGPGFIEGDFGVMGGSLYPGLRLTGVYDFVMLDKPTSIGVFSIYGGPGLSVGLYDKAKPCAGIVLQLGAEYSFGSLPFAIAIDVRPCVWIGTQNAWAYDTLIPMGSLRWRF